MITGFVFGYNDKQDSLVLAHWLLNYLRYFLLSFCALILYTSAQNHISKNYASKINYSLWGIQRYGLEREAKFPRYFLGFKLKSIPLGIILPLLIAFLSDGGLFFAAVLSSAIIVDPIYRLGRQYARLTEFEEAKIAVAGPLSNIILALLIQIFNIAPLHDMVFVCSMIAIGYMFPLPGLDGMKVLFGSRFIYAFSMSFILITAFLLNFVTGLTAFLIALICSLIIFVHYVNKTAQKSYL